jgi:hypothetical protein
MSWLSDNAALWAFLALPLMIVIGMPGFGQLILSIRESGRSTPQLYGIMRATGGRVRGVTLTNALAHSASYYPQELSGLPNVRSDPVENLLGMLSQGARILLIAPAGAGKTRLLEELHQRSYAAGAALSEPLIEVVSLANYSGRLLRPSVLRWACVSVGRRYGLSGRSVMKLVAEAKIIIAFDGLDEVSDADQNPVADAIAAHAATHPTIATVRDTGDGLESGTDISHSLGRLHGLRRARIEPLTWAHSLVAMRRQGIPDQTLSEQRHARRFFCNPLNLQLLLAAWELKLLSPSDLPGLASKPSSVWSHFLDALDGDSHRLLRLTGVLSADNTRTTSTAFRALPIQLAGIAFTATRVLGVAAAMLLGWQRFPVGSVVVAVAILLTSVYPNATFFGRLCSLFSGNFRRWWYEPLCFVTSFVLVHVIRVTVWSLMAGELTTGDWGVLADQYWLLHALFLALFVTWSPLGMDTALHTWSGRSQQRLWPTFALLAGATILYASEPWNSAWFWALAYLGTASIYLAVSTLIASLIAGIPPWRWSTELGSLVRLGVLSRAGKVYRFTHTRVQQGALLRLAENQSTPRLLWKSFGAHWPEILLSVDASALWRGEHKPDRVVLLLLSRSAWSLSCVMSAVAYFQWMSINPQAAARLTGKHMRLMPRSGLVPCDIDARDRIGDDRALKRARDFLARPKIQPFELHWCFRVLERHLSRVDLQKQVFSLVAIHSDKRDVRRYLDLLSIKFAGAVADGSPARRADERLLRAELLLEAPTHDLHEIHRLLLDVPPSAMLHAAQSQLAHLLGDRDEAETEALEALDRVDLFIGYRDALVVMVTAAVLAHDADATAWLERALETDMRLRFRDGLMRTLNIPSGAPLAAVFDASLRASTPPA